MSIIIILVAKYFIVIPIILTLLLAWKQDSRKSRIEFILWVALTGALAYAIASIAGSFIEDPRPFAVGHFTPLIAHAADNGFPSDHTLLAAALAFAALRFSKRYAVIMGITALLIGGARVAAGVHHWEDIIGSLVISAVAVAAVYGLKKLITYESQTASASAALSNSPTRAKKKSN
jgi:undecaprenyl-diphosphatase